MQFFKIWKNIVCCVFFLSIYEPTSGTSTCILASIVPEKRPRLACPPGCHGDQSWIQGKPETTAGSFFSPGNEH